MTDQKSILAELITQRPAGARVLQRHGLDFCCGGKQTLEEACRRAHIDAGQVLAELAEADSSAAEIDATALSSVDLVDHILRRYHDPLRPELARLLDLARKAERVHGQKSEWPAALVAHLESVREAIENHLAKEEKMLFPAIQAGRGHLARMPVEVMIREHEHHGANLKQTRALTGGFLPPVTACATWRALYQGLEQLELDLMTHIHLENNVLFPRISSGEPVNA